MRSVDNLLQVQVQVFYRPYGRMKPEVGQYWHSISFFSILDAKRITAPHLNIFARNFEDNCAFSYTCKSLWGLYAWKQEQNLDHRFSKEKQVLHFRQLGAVK